MRRLSALLLLIVPLGGPERAVEAQTEQEACLGSLIYHEARGEPLKGQRAVLDIVYHRVVQSGLPPCQVVAQKQQFAWYGKKPMKRYEDVSGLLVSTYQHPKVLKSEKFFFSGKRPVWAKDMICRKIGRHYFCREKTLKN